ncbi:MAG: extracellular solute-binding protein [Victivallaceae bacterium]
MSSQRLLSIICLTLFFVTAHAGYIEVKNDKTIIHVKVFNLPDPSNPDTINRTNVEVVKAFRKDFPQIFKDKYRAKYQSDPATYGNFPWENVEIQLDQFSSIQVEGVETDLLAIAGGLAPDVLYLNFRKSDTYIRNSFLYPLDEYFKSVSQAELDFRINSKIWPVIDRKGPTGQKHIWALPYGGALGRVLIYRKDLFDEYGVSYPDEKWTWEDMYDACKKITDPGKGIYGLAFAKGKHESWVWCPFLWSAGGDVMMYDEDKDQWECTFDSDEAVKALDFYTKLNTERWIDKNGKIRRGYSYKDASDSNYKWERGDIAMAYAYIEENTLAHMNPDTTGMAPVPIGPDGHRGSELNSRMFGIFSQIEQVAVRDAAWEYMFYWDCRKAQEIRTKIMVEGGYGRFVNPKYLKLFGYNEILRLIPPNWLRTFEVAIETGKPEPYGKNSNVAYNVMTIPINEAEQLSMNDELPACGTTARANILKQLLKDSCAHANEVMIGKISPQEKYKRRIIAYVILGIIALAFALVFKRVFKLFTPVGAIGDNIISGKKRRQYLWAYVLLIPAILTVLLWQYIPLARGSYMALFDYKILGNSTFVGVDNFANMLYDDIWWRSVYDALRYSFLIIILTFLPPIILAIFLQEVPKGKMLFRLIYYLPAVITGLVTIILWKQFYEPTENGMVNMIIMNIPAIGFIAIGLMLLLICLAFARRLMLYEMWLPMICFIVAGLLMFYSVAGMARPILFPATESLSVCFSHVLSRLFSLTPEAYRWLENPSTAMLSCVIPMVWAGMGPGCLIYLAALKGIPDDFYEAAEMDGANFIDKLIFVIFPTLKVLIIINFIGVFIASWISSTGIILAMTAGSANTETAGLHIWYEAFTFLQFGPATAMAWVLSFMLIGFTVYQLQILSRVEFKTTGEK